MNHHLRIEEYDIYFEPKGEIASVSISLNGERVREFTTRISYSVVPVAFVDSGRKVLIAVSRDGKSWVMANGKKLTRNWFFNRDFLSSAHEALGLKWQSRELSNGLQVLIDLLFAIIMGYVLSSAISAESSWETFYYTFSTWFLFWLLIDFGRQKVEARRLRKMFETM